MREQSASLEGLLTFEELAVRPARSREELRGAYRRVYWSYLHREYIEPNPSEMRLSLFNAFPTTVTFVSVLRGEVIATVTLVPQTGIGLPMDDIYGRELQKLRTAGRKLAEVTMLADRRLGDFRRSIPLVVLMMKRVFDYATLVLKATDLCITINPRHDAFYERYLLFKPLGPLRAYPSVKGNPALAKRLDLDAAEDLCRENKRLRRQFFEQRTPIDLLENRYQMTCEDLHHFFIQSAPVFLQAPREHLAVLRGIYPQCPWDEWAADWSS